MMHLSRTSPRVLAVTAACVLVSLTSGCGGDTKAVCDDAMKAFQDYGNQAAASATDLTAWNKATADLAAKLDALSGRADGDMKSALKDLATSFGTFKINTADPSAAAAQLPEFASKASEATQKLGRFCS